MTPFQRVTSPVLSLPQGDIDTDIIFPARFLLVTTSAGLGRYAFHDWRVDGDGRSTGSPIDAAVAAGAHILATGINFGCGSSREHAAWALADLGIRAIIAPSFGEIFRSNALNNGVLTVRLDADGVAAVATAEGAVTVDLVDEVVRLADGHGIGFAIEPWRREALLNGWDAIDRIQAQKQPAIAAFEAAQRARAPWLWRSEVGDSDVGGEARSCA